MADPDLNNMIEQEPDYDEESEQVQLIQQKAKEWAMRNGILTPRDKAPHSTFPDSVINDTEEPSKPSEGLDSLISAFISPIPNHIFTDYEKKAKKKNQQSREENTESALENFE